MLLFCLVVVALLMTQRDALREHQLYFTEERKDVQFELAELSERWSEQTLRERFAGVPIHCEPNPGNGLGDLACVLDTRSHNGVPALFITFFFTSGHLDQVSINVPWWNHRQAYKRLEATLGKPDASQILPHDWVRLHGWLLADGAGVFYNRDKALNPLEWNAIYWRSASSCAANSCFEPAPE